MAENQEAESTEAQAIACSATETSIEDAWQRWVLDAIGAGTNAAVS
jgi:hypothetical protein